MRKNMLVGQALLTVSLGIFSRNRLNAKHRPQINSKKCVKDSICFLPNKALCPAFVLYLPPSKKPAILSFANSKASIDEVHRM